MVEVPQTPDRLLQPKAAAKAAVQAERRLRRRRPSPSVPIAANMDIGMATRSAARCSQELCRSTVRRSTGRMLQDTLRKSMRHPRCLMRHTQRTIPELRSSRRNGKTSSSKRRTSAQRRQPARLQKARRQPTRRQPRGSRSEPLNPRRFRRRPRQLPKPLQPQKPLQPLRLLRRRRRRHRSRIWDPAPSHRRRSRSAAGTRAAP